MTALRLSAAASLALVARARLNSSAPMWGCGILGPVPGIGKDGSANAEAQKLIDGLKVTSSFGKVTYWNWNLAPQDNDDSSFQWLSKDFEFIPEQWGMGAVDDQSVREAGKADFLDSLGNVCPATMSTLFLGANEPDIIGSCMGSMMGKCTGSCTDAEVQGGCPVSNLDPAAPPASPLPNGHCDCWSKSHATGVGFWPLEGCADAQPLPKMFTDAGCVSTAMVEWKKQAKIIAAKGYKYLSTPLTAVSMEWIESFIKVACDGCSDISCGCPTHIGWHFYAADCRPQELGGYADFQRKLQATKDMMEKYPFIQGAIVNEVGMLNCDQEGGGVCIPNGPTQKYPAVDQPNHACPNTDELPNGFATFVSKLVDMVIDTGTTKDGRPVVAGFSWFNENMAGGTYNLQIFDEDGTVNSVGDAYIEACQKWSTALDTF